MSNGNTNYGDGSLENNVNGKNNSAFGVCSSKALDVSWNTSVGAYANMLNVSGISNVAVGTNSLLLDVSGSYNTAVGTATLLNTKSNSNTAVGSNSMENNIFGSENVSIGVQSGYNTINSNKNTFLGSYSGFYHTDGSENVFLGFESGLNETNSSKNTFLGAKSGVSNIIVKYENSTAIGYGSLIDSSNQIMLGTENISTVIPGMGYLTNTSTNYTEQSIVPKKYIDTYVSGGLQITTPCECATVEDISLNPPNIPTSIDDVSLNDGMRVLIKCQDSSNNVSSLNIDNGIYVYYSTGFVRATDCSDGDNVKGQTCFIRNGTLNKSILFSQNNYNTSTNEAIVGTDELNYTEFYKITFSIGDGLEVVSNTLQVKPKITNNAGNSFLQFVGINGGNNDVSYSLDSGTKDILVNNITVGRGGGNFLENTIFGVSSGSKITSGNSNTFMGYLTGFNNTTGYENSFYGKKSGNANTTGKYNSFFGDESGLLNTTGHDNSFFGALTGRNSTGIQNSFFGALSGSGSSSFTGNYNVGVGWASGNKLSTGEHDTLVGRTSGQNLTTGNWNTIVGSQSGQSMTTNSNNSLFGYNSGTRITSGDKNTFIGSSSGDYSNSISQCTYLGFESGRKNYGNNCTFIGSKCGNSLNNLDNGSDLIGSNNTFLGMEAGCYSNLPNQNVGGNNTFLGYHSGYEWEDGSYNSFIGTDSGRSVKGSHNSCFGSISGTNISTGSYNTLIGYNTNVDLSKNISHSSAIGYNATIDSSNQIVLGTSSERTKIPGKFWCINDASFSSNVDVSGTLSAGNLAADSMNIGTGGIDCSGNFLCIDDASFSSNVDVSGTLSAGNLVADSMNIGTGGIDCSGIFLCIDDASFSSNVNVSGTLSAGNLAADSMNIGTGGIDCSGNFLCIDDASFSSNVDVSGALTMVSTNPLNRQISSSYYNFTDGGTGVTNQSYKGRIFTLGNTIFFSNDASSGTINFYNTNSSNVGSSTMALDSSFVNVNRSLLINGSGNYLQFPDGTRQTTATSYGLFNNSTQIKNSGESIQYRMQTPILSGSSGFGSASSAFNPSSNGFYYSVESSNFISSLYLISGKTYLIMYKYTVYQVSEQILQCAGILVDSEANLFDDSNNIYVPNSDSYSTRSEAIALDNNTTYSVGTSLLYTPNRNTYIFLKYGIHWTSNNQNKCIFNNGFLSYVRLN